MSERGAILARVREALRVPGGPPPASARPPERLRPFLPPGGASPKDRIERFRVQSEELRTEFRLVDGEAGLEAALRGLRESGGWKRVASHRGELTDRACRTLGIPVLLTDTGYDANDLESCDAGLTECDALVAQTGSVLLTSRSAGGRALSVLPPHHVVLARREQLVGDLLEAYALLKQRYAADYPSMISLVTGPSRTGDIERIIVLGAHGPKRLSVLCL